jgi:hypothetical protein
MARHPLAPLFDPVQSLQTASILALWVEHHQDHCLQKGFDAAWQEPFQSSCLYG